MKFDRLPARLVFAQSKLALTALSLTLSPWERGWVDREAKSGREAKNGSSRSVSFARDFDSKVV